MAQNVPVLCCDKHFEQFEQKEKEGSDDGMETDRRRPDQAERVTIEPEGTRLLLNGAGVRKKFFVKVYVGALYLPENHGEAEAVLDLPGAKRVTMHFLHSEVSAEKISDGWNRGFAANQSAEELARLKERLSRFNSLFRTAHKGDLVRLDYIPGTVTRVWMNEELLGTISGEDFYRALLMVWLGPNPADSNLKQDMLGHGQ